VCVRVCSQGVFAGNERKKTKQVTGSPQKLLTSVQSAIHVLTFTHQKAYIRGYAFLPLKLYGYAPKNLWGFYLFCFVLFSQVAAVI